MNQLDYVFAVGVVRALEAQLISEEQLLKLKNVISVNQFKNELNSLNYRDFDCLNLESFRNGLQSNFFRVVNYLIEICPKETPFNLFFFNNDCFNLKSFLMSKFFNFKFSGFVKPNFLSVDLIVDCVDSNDFDLLPTHFKNMMDVLVSGFDSGLNQFELYSLFEKQLFETKLKLSSINEFLFNRTKLEVDLFNLGLILKALKLNFTKKVLKISLIEGGFLDCELIFKAFLGGLPSLDKFCLLNFGAEVSNMLNGSFEFLDFSFKKFAEFDLKTAGCFCGFAPIFAYLNKLKCEHTKLEQILTKLSLVSRS